MKGRQEPLFFCGKFGICKYLLVSKNYKVRRICELIKNYKVIRIYELIRNYKVIRICEVIKRP